MNEIAASDRVGLIPSHWPLMARYWEQIGPPLRPSPKDIAAYEASAGQWIQLHGPPCILLLGVTPELYRIPWPEGSEFLALDQSDEMIEYVWPGRKDEVLRGNWLDLPFAPGSRDLVLCDGGLHLLNYPTKQMELIRRLHAVIAPSGRCIFRLFANPGRKESPKDVLQALFDGEVPSVNVLKLRLGMALQESAKAGVAVHRIWRFLKDHGKSWKMLAANLGWPVAALEAIDTYRSSQSTYHFISLEQATELFCSEGGFRLIDQTYPSYPLGERCPIVTFERI